ncbi:glycosyltransferase family 2 protein [Salibacterium sp. K-3]
MTSPLISVIFPAKNEGRHVKDTLDSLAACRTRQTYEVIVVDDGSSDGCCDFLAEKPDHDRVKRIRTRGIGAANARNLGADHASGTYLAFCDAHLFFHDYWIDKLLFPLQNGETDVVCPAIADTANLRSIGYGQTLKPDLSIQWLTKKAKLTDIPVVPGGCFLLSRHVFEDVSGFDEGLKRWGLEDIELSIKLWLFGWRCSVLPSVTVQHVFRNTHPYQVEETDISYNLLRTACLHFNTRRVHRCRKLAGGDAYSLEKKVRQDGADALRKEYNARRTYDDNWYFRRFAIPF